MEWQDKPIQKGTYIVREPSGMTMEVVVTFANGIMMGRDLGGHFDVEKEISEGGSLFGCKWQLCK